MGNELSFQGNHASLVTDKERVTIPKHFAAHPWYHGLENDCFMYSIHNIVKEGTPTQLVEETSTDMMCMIDDISFMDDLVGQLSGGGGGESVVTVLKQLCFF
jgi:hypothetical protein